jgi:hypothetical protein
VAPSLDIPAAFGHISDQVRLGAQMRSGLVAVTFLISLVGIVALAQQPTPGRMADVIHDGWYFRGNAPADAEARRGGTDGTAVVVDCHNGSPRVMVFWRDASLPSGAVTTTKAIEATFQFTKRSIASALTQHFDTQRQLQAFGEHVTSAPPNAAPISEHINFDGAEAMKVMDLFRSMDHVSVSAYDLGPPVAFDLAGAPAAIDQLLSVCSRH